MNKYWTMKNAADDDSVGEIYIYGDIMGQESWWGDGSEVTPTGFKDELDALGTLKTLNVYINSYGGDVFAGHAIFALIKRHEANTVVTVDGIAASAASVIAVAGDEVIMPTNSMMMIHDPWMIALGDADEMRAAASALDSVKESIVAAYRTKTDMSETEIAAMMKAETWFTAAQAVENGFADTVNEMKVNASMASKSEMIVNGISVRLDRYKNSPPIETIVGKTPAPAPKDATEAGDEAAQTCLLYTSPSPRDS